MTIRLDKSKKHSTVHGDRTPADPHYRVHFWQDDLPFDVNGEIIAPTDAPDQPFTGHDSEGKPTMFQPLYNAARRERLQRKLERFSRAATAEVDVPLETETDAAALERAAEEVNFEDWLRGAMQYEPLPLRKAFEMRYHRKTHRTSEIVVELVVEHKLVPEREVVGYLRSYLTAYPKKDAA